MHSFFAYNPNFHSYDKEAKQTREYCIGRMQEYIHTGVGDDTSSYIAIQTLFPFWDRSGLDGRFLYT